MNTPGTKSRGFVGTLNNVQLSDILQMCCIGGTSTAIRVTKDGREGTIYLVEGEIVHAEAGDISGEKAFFAIMGWNQGNFESILGQVPDTNSIVQSWQHLLLEACRRQDEDSPTQPLAKTDKDKPFAEIEDTRIRVLIVDDSSMMRKALATIFDETNFLIVGSAANGAEALDLIPSLTPDVITLDVNMPVMDGISTLKRIMIQFPLPTVMVSAMTQDGATITFDALKYGAVDFIPKPSQLSEDDKEEQIRLIREKIQLASKVSINSVRYIRRGRQEKQHIQGETELEYVACMVAGEGGYGALLKIVPQLDPNLPAAFLVVLYGATEHVDAFAHYLNQHSQITVQRATNGNAVQPGICYLVSGQEYATIEQSGRDLLLQLTPSSFPNRRGAADILMISLAEKFGPSTVGITLSGASSDGSDGLNELLHSGGKALVQSPETCLLKEMAEAALKKCDRALVIADDEIAAEITRIVRARAN
ncbi:response regulator [Desulfobulbus rhabdoformis]|uniref:chemotaxis protein CheB n=1 Tax=Desulfobulbus rhabdoformis TaxID=34032 RepID=UPI001964F542|nr:chemotaxis protein CheB [Desulfobulbus rhabdoformis]MBM9614098.1 response regulator [Desulfobulbus rhabdoformis]